MSADLSTELLHTISEVLDIRSVFPRVSEIANHVLPHDWLGLVFHDHSDRVTLQARSAKSFPEFRRLAVAGDGDDQVVSDIEKERLRIVQIDPPDFIDRILAEGYRSFLNVRSMAGEQVLGLGFFSKRPDAYSMDDLPMARRIAECLSVAVSHEQLAEAERQRAEARVRDEVLNAQVKSIVKAAPQSQHGSVIGQSPAWRDVLKKATQVAATETTASAAGRVGHRQGSRGAVHPPQQSAEERTVRGPQLRGAPRDAPRVRAVRLRAGRVHRRAHRQTGTDRAGRGRRVVPRRSERDESVGAGEVPARAAGARVPAARRHAAGEGERAGDCRDQSRPVRGGRRAATSARTCSIACRCSTSTCRRCANGAPTSRCWRRRFWTTSADRSGGRPPSSRATPRTLLLAHDWPGNVRELRNALERAAILCGAGRIGREHLLLHSRPAAPSVTNDLQTVERRRIEQVMRETDGNKSRAASRLGLTRTQLYVRLRKYDLERPAVA